GRRGRGGGRRRGRGRGGGGRGAGRRGRGGAGGRGRGPAAGGRGGRRRRLAARRRQRERGDEQDATRQMRNAGHAETSPVRWPVHTGAGVVRGRAAGSAISGR